MGIDKNSAFFIINITPLGAAAGQPYYVIAYMPKYDGKLTGSASLPYREKNDKVLTAGLKKIIWGNKASTLPGETSTPASPFSAGIPIHFILDVDIAKSNKPTGTLVGFGQADSTNLCIYVVANKLLLDIPGTLKANLQFVCTNGNVPQP